MGSDFKEKCIELIFWVAGMGLYHLYLRPKEYWQSREKRKNHTADQKAKGKEKAQASV